MLFRSLNALLAISLSIVAVAAAVRGHAETAPSTPAFVGRKTCATCHAAEVEAWSGSHHDLAFQEASEETVLGDFGDATFTHFGVTSRFFRKDGAFLVNTEAPDGALADFEIAYSFGVDPLQQYLVEFPGGRLQVLGIAWDTRPKDQGGQRWFHLYADERIAPGDELFWTGINQNWNFMCAECHSTDLRRNYDLDENRYRTTWSDIDVACEACHGPGSEHVAWAGRARAGEEDPSYGPSQGLTVALGRVADTKWAFPPGAVTAKPETPPRGSAEIEVCAPCHSRRAPLGDGHVPGEPLMDGYRPSLLTERLYHADGQIRDEVYVYGSFLQSTMHAAGVTCGNCHDPHSLKLRAEGNGVCVQCHKGDAFDTAAHHFHAPGAPGSNCVDCHAPETTYMVVDPRRDHSFRVPRPDLSAALGAPNACTGCHDDRTDQWAADTIAGWYGPDRRREPHFGEALALGRSGAPGAESRLVQLADDARQPAIARATAIALLADYLSPQSFEMVRRGLRDGNPLVRLAAVGVLNGVDPRIRLDLAFDLLDDPVRAVRLEAARVLAPVSLEGLPPARRAALERAFAEFQQALGAIADRPESLATLANFKLDRGDDTNAELVYRKAMEIHPAFAPAYANLADLFRARNRDDKAEEVLREGLNNAPGNGDLYHSLGLLRVRQKRYAEAVEALGRAVELNPDNARYGYVHALSLQQTGDLDRALTVLTETHALHPNDRSVLFGLAAMSREAGDRAAAIRYATRLIKIAPRDPQARVFLKRLEAEGR